MNRRQAIAGCGLVALTGFTKAATALSGAPHQPIIDVHLHAYPAAMSFERPIVNPITKAKSPIRNGADHMRACFDEMRRYNIVSAVVSGGDGDRIAAALEWRQHEPLRVIAGAGIRGSDDAPLPAVNVLRQQFADGKLKVLGEVSAQYAGRTLGDPIYDPYLSLAEDLGIPVAVHLGTMPGNTTFDPCCRKARASLGHPETIEEAINRHPKLKINLMHSGWPYVEEALGIMLDYDSVNIDTGALTWLLPAPAFEDYIKRVFDAGFGKRVMFGTDQMFWPDAIGLSVGRVDAISFLTAAEKRDLFFNNAAAFYGIAA